LCKSLLFEKKKTKNGFFLSKVCLTCNFAGAFQPNTAANSYSTKKTSI